MAWKANQRNRAAPPSMQIASIARVTEVEPPARKDSSRSSAFGGLVKAGRGVVKIGDGSSFKQRHVEPRVPALIQFAELRTAVKFDDVQWIPSSTHRVRPKSSRQDSCFSKHSRDHEVTTTGIHNNGRSFRFTPVLRVFNEIALD